MANRVGHTLTQTIDYGTACGAEKTRIVPGQLGAKGTRVQRKCNRPRGHKMGPKLYHVQYDKRNAEIIDQWR